MIESEVLLEIKKISESTGTHWVYWVNKEGVEMCKILSERSISEALSSLEGRFGDCFHIVSGGNVLVGITYEAAHKIDDETGFV